MKEKQTSKNLAETLKRIKNISIEIKKKQIATIKEQERMVPYKRQFLNQIKKEKLKAMIYKTVEMNENEVCEKEKKLNDLSKIESEIGRAHV